MRLDLDDCQKIVADLHNQIPILGRPEITGQGLGIDEYVSVGEAGVAKDIGYKPDKAVAMLTAGYSRSAARVLLPGRAALPFLLAAADAPEVADGLSEPLFEVEH